MNTRIIIGAIILYIIIVVAYTVWDKKYTYKISITGLTLADGVVALTGPPPVKANPAMWIGKKITIHTKSLGKIKTTVASATIENGALGITTAAGAYSGSATYAADPKDSARISLK